jgi:hypothetical protein
MGQGRGHISLQIVTYMNIRVGFQILTAVVMKRSAFWYLTSSSPLKVNGLHGVLFRKMEHFIQAAVCLFAT